jgi:hypothetical protein
MGISCFFYVIYGILLAKWHLCAIVKEDEEFKWVETCNKSWEWMNSLSHV